ncbi:restriction endonuclease subunit S [Pseudomonas sp.]|uniref:restriction endonuclease subunit S n=1 Tax=Pseudomonas sp. TaxID=306 RepID=UPI003A985F7A
MSDLPEGWALGSLNDLIATGGLFSDGDWIESKDQDPQGENRLLQLADIGDGVFINKSSRFVNNEKFHLLNCTELEEGDLLIARMPDPLGRACLMPNLNQRCLTVVDVALFRSGSPDISHKCLMHFINSPIVRKSIELESSGTTRKRIARGKLSEIKLPIPPVSEQRRIAQKLEELLAKVNVLTLRVNAIPALLKRFRQSVLTAAISGQLTEEWRGLGTMRSDARELHQRIRNAHAAEGGHARGNASDPTEEAHNLSPDDLPDCWVIAELRDVCVPGRPITYGILKPGPELDEGIPYIRVADFPGNKLSMINIKKTSTEIDQKFKRARLLAGDLLLSIRGSVGRLIKIPSELEGANITQDTARLSISPMVSADFVYWALLANETQERMKNATRGVAVRGINIGDVRALQIPLPSFEEQTEIVRRVEQLLDLATQLEIKVASAKKHTDYLTQSILAKAFRGELVPQDPNDEPASVLLERIKAQRAAAPKAKRGRKASA